MLLRTDRDTLLAPLSIVCGVAPRRHALPVLSHALLEADGEHLALTASDLEIQLRSRRAVPTDTPFRLCLPARKLLDILRALPAGCELQLKRHGSQLLLLAAGSRFLLQALPADDFPLLEASFNLQYLQDVLTHVPAEHLRFGLGGDQRGMLVTNPDDPHFQYLAMPLRG